MSSGCCRSTSTALPTSSMPRPKRLRGTYPPLGDVAGRIRLDGVTFAYSPEDPVVLQDFTLDIAAGEMVTLTGPSGGGKTTLDETDAGALRAGVRHGGDRRARPRHDRSVRLAVAGRRGDAGRPPAVGHDCRQYRLFRPADRYEARGRSRPRGAHPRHDCEPFR